MKITRSSLFLIFFRAKDVLAPLLVNPWASKRGELPTLATAPPPGAALKMPAALVTRFALARFLLC